MIKKHYLFILFIFVCRLPKLFILNLPFLTDRHKPSPLEMGFGGMSKRQFFVIVGQLLGGHNVHFKAIIKKKKSSIIQLGAYKNREILAKSRNFNLLKQKNIIKNY